MSIPPFHLAFPVHDLEAARNFYGALLGCREGRSDRDWVDYDCPFACVACHITILLSSGLPWSCLLCSV